MKFIKRNKRGITLVALVITIIILLILAGISISILGGENGILKVAKKATQEYAINQAKEELQIAIMNLRIEEESKGDKLDKEDLPRLNNEKIDVGDITSFPIEIIYENYLFNIDEWYNLTYIGEANRTKVTYTTDPQGYTNSDSIKILIKFKNSKGIKTIEYPDGDKLNVNGEKERAIDYTVTKNGTYSFKIIDIENKEVKKDIVIQYIDKLEPIDFVPQVVKKGTDITIISNAKDAEADETSVKSGIEYCEYYLKAESESEYTKYDTNQITELKVEKYNLYVIAYDRAKNEKKSSNIQFEVTLAFSKIESTKDTTMAIDTKGNLWSWGYGSSRLLGTGTLNDQRKPVQIKEGTKFTQISAGMEHCFAIDTDGQLWGWGSTFEGKLGDGTSSNSSSGYPLLPVLVDKDIKFSKIFAASRNSYALDANENMWSWGSCLRGALGYESDKSYESRPTQVPTDIKFSKISGGSLFALGIDKENNLFSWGRNCSGEVGIGTLESVLEPTQIKSGTKFKEIATGNEHSLAIDGDGNIWAWGKNGDGQIGNGTTENVLEPIQITKDIKFVKIESLMQHNLAIDEEGNIWAWGNNTHGQIGNGTKEDVLRPTQVTENVKFTEISTTQSGSIAIDEENNLWIWGYDAYLNVAIQVPTMK